MKAHATGEARKSSTGIIVQLVLKYERCAATALLLAATLLVLALTHPTPVRAAGVVGDGAPESCTEAALAAALAGGGLVTFECGAEPVTITLASEKVITSDTMVDGEGTITLSGGGEVRVFHVRDGAALTVEHLTIAGGGIVNDGRVTVTNSRFQGNSAFVGGGIFNSRGTLTVTNSTFAGNSASGVGGGIANDYGTLTVTNSTFGFNSAGDGGGIFNSGTLTVSRSTFAGNSASGGGGIENTGGTVAVINSTFAANSANVGGGIWSHRAGGGPKHGTLFGTGAAGDVEGTLTVTNSTFAGNRASSGGGGIEVVDGTLILTAVLLANRPLGSNCFIARPYATVTDGGHNLVNEADSACGLTDGVNGNIVGLDAQLDPAGLADNGGPTQTIALLPDSPAIDAADPEVCAKPPVNGLDQRGYLRPGRDSTTCSIGAYEYQSLGLPGRCVGDCKADGEVTIDEIILLVNMALGNVELNACMPSDADGDGAITVDEIMTAVNNALQGCPIAPPNAVCVASGGTVTSGLCCSGAGDFPDTCAIGACGCAPESSEEVSLCDCGEGRCFDTVVGCAAREG